MFVFSFKKGWNPDGKHCYVTGGSSGLGLALAKILVAKGAHVSIVARDQAKLDAALVEMEAARVSPSQKLQAKSADLLNATASTAALEAVCELHDGAAPDAVFTCAGSSKPMFFVEMTEQDMKDGMDYGYWVQAWTVWAVTKMLVKQKKRGAKICMVSSMLGLMSFAGYASYAPAKHALRGLADTLQSEFMLYDIESQIFFPPTIYSPGYVTENKTKPDVIKKIEGTDEGLTPEQAAQGMLKGFVRGDNHISADLLTDIFRAGTRGSAPRVNFVFEAIYDFISYVGVPIWRRSVDGAIRGHREEHDKYLHLRGFFG
ncbi:oxidoreductase [Ephemerocybe angulata]|uniref:3-dehydrosphinganine reductase n=1 Tax=Ephemerocybe angulata TaxID=980116 RepID=A0A8H6M8Q8_9AGAR|nr:oxidoreductase [Tulosesus angulatus]